MVVDADIALGACDWFSGSKLDVAVVIVQVLFAESKVYANDGNS